MTRTNGILRRARSRSLAGWAIWTAWLAASTAPAAQLPDARLEAVAREVRELRAAADALLAPLTPRERELVEARLVELAEAAPPEAAADAPEPATPPTTPPSVEQQPSSRPAPPPAMSPCRALAAFDRDADGIVSAVDRGWRHLYLWQDDGDGALEETEVSSLFERGVRALDTTSRTYTTATGFVGDLEIGDGVSLEVPSRRRGSGFERGELVVDNDGLRRAGEPTVRSAIGQELAGYQPLRRGSRLAASDGSELALPCDG
jgi:hypothetical protein